MNNLKRHIKSLLKWMLAGVLLAPALAFAHGAVDIPIARQVYCKTLPDFWSGSPSDAGCAALDAASGQYPGQQWNEVAHLIAAPGYNDPDTVKREVPDGQLCSAADSKKAGLNLVSPDWFRTDVTPQGGMMDVRIIGTAPHVPSFANVYITKPGFNPTTTPLTWNNLVLIHTEQLTIAQTNWGSVPPAIPGASGFFQFKVPLPAGQTGLATLFVHWQRIDPAGEGFYNCIDINLVGASLPGSLFDLGQFIDAIMSTLKPGDAVHFRILDNSPAAKEVVDITLPITQTNLDPTIWGQQLASQINPAIAKVGEKQGNNVTYNAKDPSANSVFALAKGYSKAMSIIPGGGQTPVNPAAPSARITGPISLKSEEAFTFSGTGSTGSNGPLLYQWAVPGMEGSQSGSTLRGKAFKVVTATVFTARLNVRDQQNGKTSQATLDFTVSPSDGGGTYPAWVANGGYIGGSRVSNRGKNYECKPGDSVPWCNQAVNEPGTANVPAWERAWRVIP
ncbi:lytic polysaccharide monooxygenase [Pseudomonas sp. LF245]